MSAFRFPPVCLLSSRGFTFSEATQERTDQTCRLHVKQSMRFHLTSHAFDALHFPWSIDMFAERTYINCKSLLFFLETLRIFYLSVVGFFILIWFTRTSVNFYPKGYVCILVAYLLQYYFLLKKKNIYYWKNIFDI